MERTESNVDRKCNGKNREQISEGCWQEIQNNREQKNRTTENRKTEEKSNQNQEKPTEKWKK